MIHNQFDPASAEAAGVRLSRVVWVRCSGKLDDAMRATDLLVHAGGFGVIHLDLCETAPKQLNKNTAIILVSFSARDRAYSCDSICGRVDRLQLKYNTTTSYGQYTKRYINMAPDMFASYVNSALPLPCRSRP